MPLHPGPQEHGFIPSHLGEATAAEIGPERERLVLEWAPCCQALGRQRQKTRDRLVTMYQMCQTFLLEVPCSLLVLSCPCSPFYRLLVQSISLSPGEQILYLLTFLSQKYLVLTYTPFYIIFRLLAYR